MKQLYSFIGSRKTMLALLSLCFIGSSVFSQIPNGYYNAANGKTGPALKAALNGIISGHTTYPYSSSNTDVWDILKAADKDPNNSSNVIGIYSGFSMNAAAEYAGGAGWNREHVWAKSRGNFGTSRGAGTDCHHIVAADVSTNSARNNRNFDWGNTIYVDGSGNYSGTTESKTHSSDWVWEPRDSKKGDVARMIFYMATRYEGVGGEPDLELTEILLNNTDKSPVHAKLSVLLAWHQMDPVSAEEQNRNNVIYSYQNNRNPFIDHPEYVCQIWACANNNNAPTFTSDAVTNAAQGQVYTYNIATADIDGNSRTITATTKPSWLTFTDNGNGTGKLTGTPANAGNHPVVLNVSDGNLSTTQSFTIVVTASGGGGGVNASNLIISEYIEGSSFNKGLEIANFTGSSVALSNYSLKKQSNGSGNWGSELTLSGTLNNGQVYVIVHNSANAAMKAKADLQTGSGSLSFNGNDPVGLFKNGTLIDVVGVFNSSATFGKDKTLVRNANITAPNTTYTTSEWTTHASNTTSFLGSHTMTLDISDTQAPTAPTNLTTSNTTETSTTLSWTAATDNVAVTGYDVFVGNTLKGSTANTTFNITGLTANTAYVITVKAKDAAGNISVVSSALNLTTPDQTAPSVPSGLAASNVGQTTLTLSWTASTDNVAVTTYDVYVGATLKGSTSATTYSVTGLTANTAYSLTVKAKDAAGNISASSTALNVTTAAAPSCTDVTLTLVLDNYPSETSWNIKDNTGKIVKSGSGYTFTTTIISKNCLPAGCYTFNISDTYGDGICCAYGNGSYNLRNASGTLLASGGNFTSSQTTNFCLTNPSARNSGATSYVEEFVPVSAAKLYPNPVTDHLYLNIPVDVQSIDVITADGKSVHKVNITKEGIDVNLLESGIYMVIIQTKKGLIKERFVKE